MGKRISNWAFRPKVDGLEAQCEIAELDDGSVVSGSIATRSWRHVFGSGAATRPSCHRCKYADMHRPSDVTVGDFWGVEKVLPGFDDGRGVSIVLANSTVGLNSVVNSKEATIVRVNPSLAANERQPALSRPHAVSTARTEFFESLSCGGFKLGSRRLGIATLPNIAKRRLLGMIGKGDSMVDPKSADGAKLFGGHYYTGCDGYPICDDPLLCTGCTACFAACPNKAIQMQEDQEGFLYPVIDEKTCVQCGLCRKACPSNGSVAETLKRNPIAAYAFKNCDSVRAHSSSGGAFWALVQVVLDMGGVVYGAAFDSELIVRHVRCETATEARSCCGSKYVQSAVGDAFAKVHADLRDGKTVLFSGTPCQVAGLKSYLNVRGGSGKLIAVDLLCHGVSSPLLFRNHLGFLRERYGTLSGFLFRDKAEGWHAYKNVAVLEDGSRLCGYDVGAYQEIFDYSYAARPSCASCPYACGMRVGDVSLADYWGVERHHPNIDDDKGTSLVLVNSPVGVSSFNNISGELIRLSSDEYDQPVLRAPSPAAPNRRRFWSDYRLKGYAGVLRQYTCFGLIRRAMRLGRRRFRTLLSRGRR